MAGNKRQQATCYSEHIPNKMKTEARLVRKFWKEHYRWNSKSLPRKLKAVDIYQLCQMRYPELQIDLQRFHRLTRNEGVKASYDKNTKIEHYYADPLTDLSCSFHGVGTGERPLSLSLLNVP